MKKTVKKAYSYIRMSTPSQLKGDSLRRQLEASTRYAEEKGLVLDTTLDLKDLGLSAYSGKNRTHGALGLFLKLVEEGRIEKGSTLIVESLDRLSREQVLSALGQFTSIISAGITIVTLTDRMEYNTESIGTDFTKIIYPIIIMGRAHEESDTKSQRLTAAWENKRKLSRSGGKLTRQCPEWLELAEDRRSFTVLQKRAVVIQRIYELKLSGFGPTKIEGILNSECQDLWMPKNGWRRSYIQKILRNPAVIGEYQPHHMVDGKRTPIGEPILDYFPPVVETSVFYAVDKQRDGNRTTGGKTGKARNLFPYIVKCGFCGAPMQFVDKGSELRYLVCCHAKRGVGCECHSIRYDEVQSLVLEHCRGLNVDDLLKSDREQKAELTACRREQAEVDQLLKKCKQNCENLVDQIADACNADIRKLYEQKLKKLRADNDQTTRQGEELQLRIAELSAIRNTAEHHFNELIRLIDEIAGDADNNINLRLKLREELRRLISEIKIFPVGYRNLDEMPKKYLRLVEHGHTDLKTVRAMFQEEQGNKKLRRIRIHFSNGSVRTLAPEKKNPLVVDFQKPEKKLYIKNELWLIDL